MVQAVTTTTDAVKEMNLILLGDQGVGKTQLIKVYGGKGFSEIS